MCELKAQDLDALVCDFSIERNLTPSSSRLVQSKKNFFKKPDDQNHKNVPYNNNGHKRDRQ